QTECFNFMRVLVALNQSHLYACGTFAFSPACAYVDLENFTLVASGRGQPYLDGKGQCPFDPQHTHTALLADGELYAGTMNNFQGNEPIISRSLGARTPLKTDAFLRWLAADAAFVASFSAPGDDKVYFFFEETAAEFDFFERLLVARVARVCKGDVGGDKVLQKKWTTFLKAQLACAQPGRFPFNVIRHASAVPRRPGRADFYAVFSSQWCGRGRVGMGCAWGFGHARGLGCAQGFGMRSGIWDACGDLDVQGVWAAQEDLGCARGFGMRMGIWACKGFGMCMGIWDALRDLGCVRRFGRARGLGCTGGFGMCTGIWDAHGDLGTQGPHVIERIQLFRTAEPVRSLLLAPGKGVLYVGYSEGVVQVPLANCSGYRGCAECLLARDPYCAW
ncbi:SEM4A protein, partial [Crypturellus soui]|nr:SEM4A protein [Crypturellus soui]